MERSQTVWSFSPHVGPRIRGQVLHASDIPEITICHNEIALLIITKWTYDLVLYAIITNRTKPNGTSLDLVLSFEPKLC